MKLHYYPETDSLYIELKSVPGAEAREIVEGLVVDFDANGDVVGFDIDHASRKLDLSKIETIALPLRERGGVIRFPRDQLGKRKPRRTASRRSAARAARSSLPLKRGIMY